MLKPSQIREKEFAKTTMGGYKTADVDGFLDEISESYEQLYKENSELLKKLRLLVDNIEEYRRKERSTTDTADVIAAANEEAERIISQARLEAQRIIAEAAESSAQASDEQSSLDELRALRKKEEQLLADVRAESEKFRRSLLAMYTEHLTLIQSMIDGKMPAPSEKYGDGAPGYEKKLDIHTAEIDEKFAYDDIDAFFAEAMAQENNHIKEAFGGIRFEMGGEAADDGAEPDDNVSDFEEPMQADPDHLIVHSEPKADEKGDGVKPGFKISFPDEDEASDNEEEDLDDLFAGFFNNGKPE